MIRATLAGVTLGDGLDVAVMGALNVSPESFYAGSVVSGRDRLLGAGGAPGRGGGAPGGARARVGLPGPGRAPSSPAARAADLRRRLAQVFHRRPERRARSGREAAGLAGGDGGRRP